MKIPEQFPLHVFITVIVTLTVAAISTGTLYLDFIELINSGMIEKHVHDSVRASLKHTGLTTLVAALPVILLASIIYFRSSQPQQQKISLQAAMFRTLANTVHEAVFLIDTDGHILFVNLYASSLFGFTEEELIDANIKLLMPSSTEKENSSYRADQLQTGFRKTTGIGQQLTGQRKDGDLFPIHLTVGDVGLKQKHLYLALITDLSTQQKLQREILELPERERQRIGEELHDGLGQQLTGLTMLAESLLNKASRPEHELAHQLASGLHDALNQVRAMSRGLMPVQIYTDGFIISLEEISESIEHQSHIPIRLQIDDTIHLPDDETATHLYRIVQESLNNAVKHASASHIIVSLKKEHGHGLLEIIDDGVGMPADLGDSNGLGLHIMRHRCGMFDGEITINPAGHRGTQVRCRFPINPVKQASQPKTP